MKVINKSAIVTHATETVGEPITMSGGFSAGQYWCCFELVAASGSGELVIARVWLPKCPGSNAAVNAESELYSIECEVATMKFLQDRTPKLSVPAPRLYAYERPGSEKAAVVGAMYMLIEGFYGNILQGVDFSICKLPWETQDHIITQWTSIKAELAAITFPVIGSICKYSKEEGPTIGKLAHGAVEGLSDAGPFADGWEYYKSIAKAKFRKVYSQDKDGNVWNGLGHFVFQDIVQNTTLFRTDPLNGPFHFNHMDMGMQNILVDAEFNFLAIIDWEFAQSAPVEVNNYPIPFPLVFDDAKIDNMVKDKEHVGHDNAIRHGNARSLYRKKLCDAEMRVSNEMGAATYSYASDALGGRASRIFSAWENWKTFPGVEEELTREMVRLAYSFADEEAKTYLAEVETRMSKLQP